jgi:hypothetical protein
MMNNIFDISIKKLGVILNVTFLRHALWYSLANAMMQPLISLNRHHNVLRTRNLSELEKTGQVCALEGMLNDRFDVSERRITIKDAEKGGHVHLLWSDQDWLTIDDPMKIYLWSDQDNSPLEVWGDSDSEGNEYAFYVDIHFYMNNQQLIAVRYMVNRYRLAGKLFEIRFANN